MTSEEESNESSTVAYLSENVRGLFSEDEMKKLGATQKESLRQLRDASKTLRKFNVESAMMLDGSMGVLMEKHLLDLRSLLGKVAEISRRVQRLEARLAKDSTLEKQ